MEYVHRSETISGFHKFDSVYNHQVAVNPHLTPPGGNHMQ